MSYDNIESVFESIVHSCSDRDLEVLHSELGGIVRPGGKSRVFDLLKGMVKDQYKYRNQEMG
jgi:hypothetical protein